MRDFAYDEDLFDAKINKSIENNRTLDKFINLLKKKNYNGDLNPLNPYLQGDLTILDQGPYSPPIRIDNRTPQYDSSREEETVLLDKVPLFKKEKDAIEEKEFNTHINALKTAAGFVSTLFLGGVVGLLGLGTMAVAAGSNVAEQSSISDLKEDYSEILHNAAVTAGLKEMIVQGKITSEEVLDICRNS